MSFTHYPDSKAAVELQQQMKRYATDKYSAAATALDYAAWFFHKKLFQNDIAFIIEREKRAYLSCEDNALKEADCKSILQYVTIKLHEAGYTGVAIVFENHLVNQFGEFDEVEPRNRKEKKEMQIEETKRVIENIEVETWKQKKES